MCPEVRQTAGRLRFMMIDVFYQQSEDLYLALFCTCHLTIIWLSLRRNQKTETCSETKRAITPVDIRHLK